jgi:hypothetical protein
MNKTMDFLKENIKDVKMAIAIGIIWGIGVACGWYLTKTGFLM